MVVDDKQIDAALADLGASFPSRAAYNAYVENYPEQAAGLRKQIRSRLLREALAGYRPSDPISDADARAYYTQHATLYHVPAHLRAQEIVIALPAGANPEEIAARTKKATDAAAMAKNPKNAFAGLARTLSEAPSAVIGGDLGNATKESIEPALWTALNALKPGQTSGVIKTASGLHILHLISREPAADTSFEKARPGIEKSLRMVRRSGLVGTLMATLRKQASIDNLLERRYVTPPPLSAPPQPAGASAAYPGASAARAPVTGPPGAGPSAGPAHD